MTILSTVFSIHGLVHMFALIIFGKRSFRDEGHEGVQVLSITTYILIWIGIFVLWVTFEGGAIPITVLAICFLYLFTLTVRKRYSLTVFSMQTIHSEMLAILVTIGLMFWIKGPVRWV